MKLTAYDIIRAECLGLCGLEKAAAVETRKKTRVYTLMSFQIYFFYITTELSTVNRVRSAGNVTVITRNLLRNLRVGKIENYA